MSEYTPDLATVQTFLYGFSMWAIGMWFGTQYVGRRAYQPTSISTALTETPDWVHQVQSVNRVLIAVFALGMLGVLYCDYVGRQEEEGA